MQEFVGLVVLIAICGVVYYLISSVKAIPDPFKQMIQAVLIAVCAITFIFWVAGLFGWHAPEHWLR